MEQNNGNCFSFNFLGEEIKVEFKRFAYKAEISLLVSYRKNILLVTLITKELDNIEQDFLSLNVSFQEKMYAINKIPQNYFRREGRGTEYSILISRVIDRIIRPLLDKKLKYSFQIVNTVIQLVSEWEIRFLAIFSSLLCIFASKIPILNNNKLVSSLIINSNNLDLFFSETFIKEHNLKETIKEIILALNEDFSLLMIEVSSEELKSKVLLVIIETLKEHFSKLFKIKKSILSKIALSKLDFKDVIFYQDFPLDDYTKIINNIFLPKNVNGQIIKEINLLQKNIESNIDSFNKHDSERKKFNLLNFFRMNFFQKIKSSFVNFLVKNKIRLDGRREREIRKLKMKTNLFSELHGSAIFERDLTQVLSIVTISSLRYKQNYEEMSMISEDKRFFHHYNFPKFSVGEIGINNYVNRREIGHGNLVNKAILAILPSEEEFPYTIRVVSEVLSSDGSTSQASICATSLCLAASGIPIKKIISGISIGFVRHQDKKILLTDITGFEDNYGEMDLKIAQSINGLCAIQMDLKIAEGIELNFFLKALEEAKIANLMIIKEMQNNLPTEVKLHKNVPRVIVKKIAPDLIKNIIGAGGNILKQIISKSGGAEINIDADGKIVISHSDVEVLKKTWLEMEQFIKPMKVGEFYWGEIWKVFIAKSVVLVMLKNKRFCKVNFDRNLLRDRFVLEIGDKVFVRLISFNNYDYFGEIIKKG